MSSEGRLGKLLPVSVAGDEKIKAAARACDHELSAIDINAVYILSRIEELPEPVLDLLAWQFHIEGWELARTVEEKRAFVKQALELHRYKGTPWAVRRALSALSLPAEVVEWFESRGALFPYTFALLLAEPPGDLGSLLSVHADYGRTAAHLVLVTDGSCRTPALLSRAALNSASVLSALDGVKTPYGPRLCFTRGLMSRGLSGPEALRSRRTRYLSARHFPRGHLRLDAFRLSRVTSEIPPLSWHWFLRTQGYVHLVVPEARTFRAGECNLRLSTKDALSVEGFHYGKRYFLFGRLSSGLDLSVRKPLLRTIFRFENRRHASHGEIEPPEGPKPPLVLCRHRIGAGGAFPDDLSRGLRVSVFRERRMHGLRERAHPSAHEPRLFWEGRWQGTWSTASIVEGEHTKLCGPGMADLSGRNGLSARMAFPLALVGMETRLSVMCISREHPRPAGFIGG